MLSGPVMRVLGRMRFTARKRNPRKPAGDSGQWGEARFSSHDSPYISWGREVKKVLTGCPEKQLNSFSLHRPESCHLILAPRLPQLNGQQTLACELHVLIQAGHGAQGLSPRDLCASAWFSIPFLLSLASQDHRSVCPGVGTRPSREVCPADQEQEPSWQGFSPSGAAKGRPRLSGGGEFVAGAGAA